MNATNDIKIGDMIKVSNTGSQYPAYRDWISKHAPEYMPSWRKESKLLKADVSEFIVVAKNKNDQLSHEIYLIQNIKSKQVYIINGDGIELSKKKDKAVDPIATTDDMESRFEGIL